MADVDRQIRAADDWQRSTSSCSSRRGTGELRLVKTGELSLRACSAEITNNRLFPVYKTPAQRVRYHNIDIIPCAAPERSTELCSVVNVCISHGISSSKPFSPIPRTIVPSARADAVRTSGTGSSRDCFKPGIIVGRYGDRSYIIIIIIIISSSSSSSINITSCSTNRCGCTS